MDAETNIKNEPAPSDLRSRLLSAALEIISREGIKKLTMRALASRVGVSRAAPYLHFKSKDALLSGIAGEGFKKLTTLYRGINSDASLDTDLKLQHIGLAYIHFAIVSRGAFTLMFSREMVTHPYSGDLAAAASETFTEFIGAVRQFRKEHDLERIDFTLLVNCFWSTVHGLADLLINDQIQVAGKNFGYPTLLGQTLSLPDDEIASKMAFSEKILASLVASFTSGAPFAGTPSDVLP